MPTYIVSTEKLGDVPVEFDSIDDARSYAASQSFGIAPKIIIIENVAEFKTWGRSRSAGSRASRRARERFLATILNARKETK